MLTGIFKGLHSIVRIVYGRHRDDVDVTQTFSYTGSDQHFTIPAGSDVTFEVKGGGSNNAAGGKSTGTKHFDEETELSIMVGGNGGRTNNGTTYGFGGSTTYGGRGGGGLSGVFTGSGAIGANDAARALIIAGGAGGGRTGGGAGGGTNGQNGNGGSYGYAGAGGTQTGRGSGGNTRSEQFRGGGGSGTYGFGGGGGWRGGNGSGGDGSGDDDAQAGGGSGYVGRVENGATTVGGGSAAGTDGTAKIQYTKQGLFPTDYVEGYLGADKIRPNHGLPPEYKQVQYIQNDGNAYINTNYIPKAKTEFDLEFEPVNYINTYDTIMGTRVSTTSNALWFGFYAAQDRNYIEFSPDNLDPASVSWRSLGTKYKVTYHNKIISDGTNSLTLNHTQDCTHPLFLFTGNNNGSAAEPSKIKIYSLKLYEDGTIIHNYIPCFRKSDNVVGLYDIVTSTFLTNAGSGLFTAGPDIGISLDRDRIGLPTAGDTYQLVVTAIPEEIGDVGYTWTSSDPNVATVSSTGLVTCITPGNCTIVCTTNDGKYQATCSVIPSIPDYDFYYDFRGGSLAGFQAAGGTGIWTDGSYTIDSGGLGQTGGSNDRNTHAYITGLNFEGATFASIERLGYWVRDSWSNGKGMGVGTSYNGGNGFTGPGVWGRINLNTSSPGTYSTNGINYYSPNENVTDYANYASNGGETTERIEIDFINNTAKYILTGANSRTFQVALTVAQKELLRGMTGAGWNWGRGYSSYNSERIRRVKVHIQY